MRVKIKIKSWKVSFTLVRYVEPKQLPQHLTKWILHYRMNMNEIKLRKWIFCYICGDVCNVYHIVNKPKYAVCTLISLAIDITLVIWVSVKVFTRSIFSMIRNTITLTALTFTAIAFWILYFDYHNDYNGKSAERRKRRIKIK